MNKKIHRTVRKKSGNIMLKVMIAAAGTFAVLSAASFPLRIVHYEVYTNKINSGVRVAQISDLHSCRYGKNMKTLIKALENEKPDIVVLTGDIYDDKCDNENSRTLLREIGRKYPCFYIAGNHELRDPKWAEYKLEAESFGVDVLEGESREIFGIMLCGAARSADGSLGFEDSVERCASEAGEGFNLLLAHFPENIDFYLSFEKFDLILCGHAHGGQWRIPGLLNGLYSPGEGFFPKYAGGRYDFKDSSMIVSRGLSRTKDIIPRVFNNPELVIVDIKPDENMM